MPGISLCAVKAQIEHDVSEDSLIDSLGLAPGWQTRFKSYITNTSYYSTTLLVPLKEESAKPCKYSYSSVNPKSELILWRQQAVGPWMATTGP